MDSPDHPENNFGTIAILAYWLELKRREREAAIRDKLGLETLRGLVRLLVPAVRTLLTTKHLPVIAIGAALIDAGDRVPEGHLVQAITPAWIQIVEALARDPDVFYRLHWRQWEELIAGGYERYGFRVILTPRSNDDGRDIIATRDDIGAIRILDQAKHYKPGHLVTAEEVRAMWGVLDWDRRASKACISTTSDFAPGAHKEFADSMPTRIELRNGERVKEWLTASLKTKKS